MLDMHIHFTIFIKYFNKKQETNYIFLKTAAGS